MHGTQVLTIHHSEPFLFYYVFFVPQGTSQWRWSACLSIPIPMFQNLCLIPHSPKLISLQLLFLLFFNVQQCKLKILEQIFRIIIRGIQMIKRFWQVWLQKNHGWTQNAESLLQILHLITLTSPHDNINLFLKDFIHHQG